MKTRLTFIAISLAAVTALASCGGGSGTTATSGGDFCVLAEQAVTAQSQIDTRLDGTGSPSELESAFAAYLELLDDMRAAAPADLQPDVATARTAFESFDAALESIDYDVARLAADPALERSLATQLQIVQSTDVLTAMANVDAYAVAACDISLDSSGEATGTITVDTAEETAVEATLVDDTVGNETLPDTETTLAGTAAAGDGTEFCEISQELNDSGIPLDGTATPADIEAYFTEFIPEVLARFVAAVPPELADDVELLIEVSVAFGAVFEANDWDVEAAFADPTLEAAFADETFVAAGARVDEYCGV